MGDSDRFFRRTDTRLVRRGQRAYQQRMSIAYSSTEGCQVKGNSSRVGNLRGNSSRSALPRFKRFVAPKPKRFSTNEMPLEGEIIVDRGVSGEKSLR
jgi:hypothetical protein